MSHHLFADNILLFAKATNSKIKSISTLLDNFICASGMKINIAKSHTFYSYNIPQIKINQVTSISDIQSIGSLYKYIVFHILKGIAKIYDFNFIIEKCKLICLLGKTSSSNPGRLALVTSFLTSYTFTTFKLLGSLKNIMTKLIL